MIITSRSLQHELQTACGTHEADPARVCSDCQQGETRSARTPLCLELVISVLKWPGVRRDVNGVFSEHFERDDLKCSLMRGRKDDVGGRPVEVRPKPVGRGDAPSIAGREPRESILGHRRDQIVSDPPLVFQEVGGDYGTDRVASDVFRPGVAAAIAKEAGHRIGPARVELSAQNVQVGHDPSIALVAAGRLNGSVPVSCGSGSSCA